VTGDSSMAAMMESDMRRRFWVALALTVPLVVLTGSVPGIPMVVGPRAANWIGLVLPTAQVIVGDEVHLRPGDRIPVDGQLIAGETDVDESLVTGESRAVHKVAGDSLVCRGAAGAKGGIRAAAAARASSHGDGR
jgi:cation transport ATPase